MLSVTIAGAQSQSFTLTEPFGVPHPDQIIDFDLSQAFAPGNTYVTGSDGREVPFQLIAGNKLAVRARLPASLSATTYDMRTGLVRLPNEYPPYGCIWLEVPPPAIGDVLQVGGAGIPAGLLPNLNYFVVDVRDNRYVLLSPTLGGIPVTISSRGVDPMFLVRQSFAVVGTQFYAPGHTFRNGDSIRFRTTGTLPPPLLPATTYYVSSVSGNYFRLATDSAASSQILPTGPGSGIHQIDSVQTWTISSGRTPSAVTTPNAVVVNSANPSYYEVTNGLVGVRINRESAPGALSLAPIQGIQLKNGAWTALGPNRLFQGTAEGHLAALLNARAVSTTVLDSGPLKTVIRVTYAFDRPAWAYPVGCTSHNPPTCFYIPPGNGYFSSTITLQAGQPSILIEDDTDMEIRYSLNVYSGLLADQGRYRGHHSTSIENGYEVDGRQYRATHERASMDAFRDFTFSKPIYDGYTSADRGTHLTIPRMLAWNPWAYDTGWYWMLYNKSAGAGAPLVGAFVGRASLAIGAHQSGPGVYQLPNDGSGARAIGFTFQTSHRGPDNNFHSRHRVSWGIFSGDKGSDLADPLQVQNINRQMNLHGGINLNKTYRYASDFADPPGGYGRLFMEPEILRAMMTRLQQGDTAYFNYLYAAEPTARPLVDIWADATGVRTRSAAASLENLSERMLNTFINEDGIYHPIYGYWQGGLEMTRKALFVDTVLAHPLASTADKAKAKSSGALYAALLWDDDFVPLEFGENRLNAGTANMPVQMQGARDFYVLMLPTHSLLRPKVPSVTDRVLNSMRNIVNPYGAEIGCPHYLGASFIPVLNSLLQIRMHGDIDPFASEPRLARFAEFYMQLLTPGEPRFGGTRKLIAASDGSTEGTEITGQLATGFRTANPNLSSRLMGAWKEGGKIHSGFFASTLLMIDESAPSASPSLGNGNFPGYMSVLRHASGSPNESATWLFNGNFYSDHRHSASGGYTDQGALVAYALGAPLSINWGSIYYPQTPGGATKSGVIPEAAFPEWRQSGIPLTAGAGWATSTNDLFASFSSSAVANARVRNSSGSLAWTRAIVSITPDPAAPVLLVLDDFSGSDVSVPKVQTFNMMAQGAVVTPSGSITPPAATHPSLPSAGPVFSLNPGLNRLSFVGQTWNAHPTRGIDWDVYTKSSETLSANIGNWGHTWHPSREQSEFQTANGRAFEERQHILRIRGSGPFRTLILPFRKGQRPADLQVRQNGPNIEITTAGQITVINDQYYAFTNAQKRILTTFTSAPATAFGMTASGGPTEIVLDATRLTLTAHGGRGTRQIEVPVSFSPTVSGSAQPGRKYNIPYNSDEPVTLVF